MKTEADIKTQIRKMRKWKHRYGDERLSENAIERFQENISSQIRALRWVLDEKMVHYYFCNQCLFAHKGKKCPTCGGRNVI